MPHAQPTTEDEYNGLITGSAPVYMYMAPCIHNGFRWEGVSEENYLPTRTYS